MKPKALLFSVLLLTLGGFAMWSPQSVQAQVRPIATRESAPAGREPYATTISIQFTNGNGTNGFSADPVPANKRLVIEFVPNEDRVSPPIPAMFAFMMLGTTQRGDAFTSSEYAAMARDAGFRTTTLAPLPPSQESVIELHM